MKLRKHLTVGLLSAAFIGSTLVVAPTTQAAVTSCYGSAKSYTKPADVRWYPSTGRLTTTSNCADINIKPNQSAYVEVCFYPTSGGSTCNSYKYAPAGQWTVVATDVRDGTRFQFHFASGAYNSGIWAG
ncbi:hypothetical protein GCM10010377_78410 [Streptomyces viridiviolaceus]|uniref:Secreted protein n=1 Tax=Streptomyces viridiviolaceus TaxID=68282 RepID=A0ABW2EDD6_9ACTN|nr:hypothetical protein [Streptomyces viridiviolaceus]GHB76340.1 hypothetical protein GCM10010377_78410 [Streptomyces viridiviolaceus]